MYYIIKKRKRGRKKSIRSSRSLARKRFMKNKRRFSRKPGHRRPTPRRSQRSLLKWKSFQKEKRWSSPTLTERRSMRSRCRKNFKRDCFLLPKVYKYPVCWSNCSYSKKGLLAAYRRARQYKHANVARKAQALRKKLGYI